MPYLLNASYLVFLLLCSPWLLYKSLTTGKYRRGLWRKFLGKTLVRSGDAPCVWFHGVSVGEIHLLRTVVARFRQLHPDWECALSTTTDTGYEEACKRFADLPIFYWPLDFSWAVHRALRRVNPSLVVLAEGELWPNFLLAARQRCVPVAVINGRMSPNSLRNYQRLGKLSRHLVSCVDLLAVQTEQFAESFRGLGARPEQIRVTGSVKYDGVAGERLNPQTQSLGQVLGVRDGDMIWIAGSTQAPEEEIALDILRRARAQFPRLRLFLVPRQKDRFEEVATLLRRSGLAFLRRSELTEAVGNPDAVILLDTIGELGALWGLADIAFVGGSLDGRRGGQNMIEPAAYGAAVVFGPYVWNFHDTATRLLRAGAAIQIQDAAALEEVINRLVGDAMARQRLGAAALQFVRSQQGATDRTMACLNELIAGAGCTRAA